MGKNKLKKFGEMERMECVFQYPFKILQESGFPMKGLWGREYFHNDNPIVLELGCCLLYTSRRAVLVNMSPADVRKEGAAYDLPISVAILAAAEVMPAGNLDRYMIMGELSLDGSVLPIRGVLPCLLYTSNGVELTVVFAPRCVDRSIGTHTVVEQVRELSGKYGFRFYDDTFLSPFDEVDTLFYDDRHVNINGSVIYTDSIINRLR